MLYLQQMTLTYMYHKYVQAVDKEEWTDSICYDRSRKNIAIGVVCVCVSVCEQ